MSQYKTPEEYFKASYGHGPDEATVEEKAKEYKKLLEVCDRKGFKSGWASHKFKDLFGDWPPRDGFGDSYIDEVKQKKPSVCPNCGCQL